MPTPMTLTVDDTTYQLALVSQVTQLLTESTQGPPGPPGPQGKSAYDIAVEQGYSGTPAQWVQLVNLTQDALDAADAAAQTATAQATLAAQANSTAQQASTAAAGSAAAIAAQVDAATLLSNQAIAAKDTATDAAQTATEQASLVQADLDSVTALSATAVQARNEAVTAAGQAQAAAAQAADAQVNADWLATEGKAAILNKPDFLLAAVVGQANGVAALDAQGKLPLTQLPLVPVTVQEDGAVVSSALKSLNFVGSSVKASSTNDNVTVTIDAVNVVSCNLVVPAGVVSGYELVIGLSGNAGLQGTTLKEFEVTSWLGTQTVTATGNAATVKLLASGVLGTALPVTAVAIDSAGNRSAAQTATAQIVANNPPQGTPMISAPSAMGSGTVSQVTLSGVTEVDGTPFSYEIESIPGDWQLSFSKLSGIAGGEAVTITAPDAAASGEDQTVSFRARAIDSEGAATAWSTVSINVFASTVVGMVAKTVAGTSSVFGYVDAYGVDIAPDAAFFNSYAPYQLTDTVIDGQAMVRVPKFYYKVGTITGGPNHGKRAWWISDLPRGGFTLHPAFMHNGAPINQFYFGKYPGGFEFINSTSRMTSKSDTASPFNGTLTSLRNAALARNSGGVTGFMLLNIWHWSALQMLSLVEHCGFVSPTGASSYRGIDKLVPGMNGLNNHWTLVDGLYYHRGETAFYTLDHNGDGTYAAVAAGAAFPTGSSQPVAFNESLAPAFVGSAFGAGYLSPHLQLVGTTEQVYYPIIMGPGLTTMQLFGLRLTATATATGETYAGSATGYASRLAKV